MYYFRTLFYSILLLIAALPATSQTSVSGIINISIPVDSIDFCTNTIYVGSTAGFGPGDRVLLIQMKGAEADLSNTSNFGNLISYHNAGNYEFATIASLAATGIKLENGIIRQYDSNGLVQLVRVPLYTAINVDGLLSGNVWNGASGGILALETDTLRLHANIDMSEKGFRGGNAGDFPLSCPSGLGSSVFWTDTLSGKGGEKGEGIVLLATTYLASKGKALNGGGGGNDHNAGGAGGSNGSTGGKGGKNDESLFSCPGDGGIGGISLDPSMLTDKVFLGGGGGAGHGNNHHGTDGSAGGGIIFIKANYIEGNGFAIISNGGTVTDLAYGDGAGGGGAGGSVIISATSVEDLLVTAKGGKGGDAGSDQCTGPGGGGSGGVLKYSSASLWPGAVLTLSGGTFGTITTATSDCFGLSNGAQAGGNGVSVASLSLAESHIVFSTDFAHAGSDTTVCSGAFIPLHGSGGASYAWSPAAFLSDSTAAEPLMGGLENITYGLTVTDIHGCIDHDSVAIAVYPGNFAIVSEDTIVCSGSLIPLHATGGISYHWSPEDFLSDASVADPVSYTTESLDYIAEVTDANGCIERDTVSINFFATDFAEAGNDTAVCSGSLIPLHASGGLYYHWSPSDFLSDALIADPVCSATTDMMYTLEVINAAGCTDTNVIVVEVSPADFADAGNDTVVCSGSTIPLFASGGDSYIWTPDDFLSDPFISDPVSTATEDITYSVEITNAAGCTDTSTITIAVLPGITATASSDTTLCGGGQIYLHAEGGDTYHWSPSSGLFYDFYADPLGVIVSSIDYVVTVTDTTTGCSAMDTVVIEVLPAPHVIVTPDTAICAGDMITLNVSGASTYIWSSASGVPCIDCPSITVEPAASALYYVMGTNAEGCSDIDSVLVSVQICNTIGTVEAVYANIFPNPASGSVIIELDPLENITAIELTDMNGHVIKAEQNIISNSEIKIDLQNIPPQLLLIKIITPDAMHTEKLLLQ